MLCEKMKFYLFFSLQVYFYFYFSNNNLILYGFRIHRLGLTLETEVNGLREKQTQNSGGVSYNF